MQEIKQQTYTTTIKLFFFYILFPFYIGFIVNKFIQSENNIESVYNESFYLNLGVVVSMILFNLFKWLEVPSTENQKDKGYRMFIIFLLMSMIMFIVKSNYLTHQCIVTIFIYGIIIIIPISFIYSIFDYENEELTHDSFIEGIFICPITLIGKILSKIEKVFYTMFILVALGLIFYVIYLNKLNFI